MRNFETLLLIASLVIGLFLFSCKKEIEEIKPLPQTDNPSLEGVNVDLTTVPYNTLSEYQFFEGALVNQIPAEGVLPYEPASTLFTDYAKKKRFIWMPNNVKASYVSDGDLLDMPTGTVLIKTFYYDNVQPGGNTKLIETRVMIKKSAEWIFAEYVWNDTQTEAFLDMTGSTVQIDWIQDGNPLSTAYRIPSDTECMVCHKSNNLPIPIGIKPQNLNTDYDYGGGPENQLQYLISQGYLENSVPMAINSVVDYNDESKSLNKRVRSYLDINCAHCHQEGSHCDYRPLRLAYSETSLNENMGVCVEPDEVINSALTYLISPGNTARSVLYYRLESTDQNERMPLLGRSIVHTEGVALIEAYINTLTEICE
jgi:uncharacterized repeat protein (TIGR03806 family)